MLRCREARERGAVAIVDRLSVPLEHHNTNAFTRHNPLRFVDPLGTRPCQITLRGADAAAAGVEDGGTVQGECVTPEPSWTAWLSRNAFGLLDAFTLTTPLQAPGVGQADQPLVDRSPDLAVALAAGIVLPSLGARASVAGTRSTALLAQAVMTVSNRGAVAASREAALEAAEQWVGIGARLIRSRSGQVVGKISADGQRIYRTTSMSKAQPYINLENKATGGNLHVRW